jgi:Protein of unknown function (DUF3570)
MRMQLKKSPHSNAPRSSMLRQRLVAASCALLSSAGARAQSAEAPPLLDRVLQNLSVDSALAYYHEDGRIQALEPVVNVSKTFANGDALNLNFTFDSLSGSSPNGALTSHAPQTFTSPSGKLKNLYVTAQGQLPVDPNYSDTRVALSADWTMPVTRVTAVTVGAKVSGEDDFLSLTLNASIDRDFNEKNTTISAGIYNEFDSLRPIGGAPAPGSDYALADKTGNHTKDGIGALLGITQVVTRNSLSALNVSVDRFHGYLNDPYKFTSVLDASGAVSGYQFESRPDQRLRKSIYWENRAAWDTFSMGLSLRYMSDDWAVRSDTAQVHVRWQIPGGTSYIEPSVRWYRQTAAAFYTPWLLDTAPQVSPYQSSDSRLDAFHALTYGIKYAHKLGPIGPLAGSEFNVRLEYYRQQYHNPSTTLTELQDLDLFPDLKAVLVQVGWRF